MHPEGLLENEHSQNIVEKLKEVLTGNNVKVIIESRILGSIEIKQKLCKK